MAGIMQNNSSTQTSASTKSLIDQINQANATKTSRGTRIVKPGQEMDKNAFLRILSAELSNQDPQNAKDGTEYVAQMAQFANLEQMANLNSSMRMSGANSFIGRTVMLNKLDDMGQPYMGQVKEVIKNGDTIKLDVLVGKEKDSDGNLVDKYQEFNLEDVTNLADVNNVLNSIDNNLNLLNASAIIGKTVEINQKDANNNNYVGVVKQISKGSDGIKVSVEVGQDEIKEFNLGDVLKVRQSQS